MANSEPRHSAADASVFGVGIRPVWARGTEWEARKGGVEEEMGAKGQSGDGPGEEEVGMQRRKGGIYQGRSWVLALLLNHPVGEFAEPVCTRKRNLGLCKHIYY